jgi:hypothetical protein
MAKKRRTYTPEFKAEAVKLARGASKGGPCSRRGLSANHDPACNTSEFAAPARS